MRKLWPFVGIALAVAGGIALAPFWWWAVSAAMLVAAGYGIARNPRALLWPFALALIAWPVWLWQRDQHGDALFVVGAFVLLVAWHMTKPSITRLWLKAFPD